MRGVLRLSRTRIVRVARFRHNGKLVDAGGGGVAIRFEYDSLRGDLVAASHHRLRRLIRRGGTIVPAWCYSGTCGINCCRIGARLLHMREERCRSREAGLQRKDYERSSRCRGLPLCSPQSILATLSQREKWS